MPELENESLIAPLDEHNRALLEQVRPSSHVNPEPQDRYHLVVVGAGTAGLVSAAGAAGLGARVALIERHMMGGDCLNVGCVPSKGVIRAARAWHAAREGAEFGAPAVDGPGDFGRAMERMRRLRARISSVDGVARFGSLGIDVFLGQGAFTGSDTIEVDGKSLYFRRAVIATGARAAAPPIPGLREAGYLTNETLFWLEKLPHRFAVIGAGPIGCEMAQSFACFGSEVTILDRADHILPREDPDAAAVVQAAMARDGVKYVSGVNLRSVTREPNGERLLRYERDGVEFELRADEVLVGVGRAPNTDGLGLEAAGVAYDRSGVTVDDRMRTTNKRIYAAGDVASTFKFTHAADAQARIVIENALFLPRKKASGLVIPWCTYTSPEIAHVGLCEREARAQGIEVDSITVQLDDVDRAVLDGEDEGFLRLHLKQGTDRILGATLVAAHAGDMIGELVLAITHGVGLGKIGSTIHPYPTQGEVIKKAADAWRRTQLTPRVKKLFERYFRIFR
jgi:pyruvate/2-oxoglutarate dehydrogenase complex dihydrolipoamide dehydrogenase (E3) component